MKQETKTLKILATSDTHGKFVPWDYALNAESLTGSMAQLASAVKALRDENTLLLDAGDTVQDNSADQFITADNGRIHPMIAAMNAMRYDVWVPGNHEYNFGMDVLKRLMGQQEARVLTGNVRDAKGAALADAYIILEKNGLRIGIIGMITPNITRWDAVNLKGWQVSDPLEETRKLLKELRSQSDVLIGVYHMGLSNEYGTPNSGVTDILKHCPEFDLMIAAHEHREVSGQLIGGVPVVENLYQAQTMAEVVLTLGRGEETDGKWKVTDRKIRMIEAKEYGPDPELMRLLAPYDEQARRNAEVLIGRFEGESLAPVNEIAQIPEAQIRNTALIDLINRVQMYYTGAAVSATSLSNLNANLFRGPIRRCDVSLIYRYTNSLYKVKMNGRQLKAWMEWSASYFNTWHPGDLTISFRETIRAYNYDVFSGVRYEINLSKEPGNRIENLTWADGRPVGEEETFTAAVNNYRVTSQLCVPGEIYGEGDVPQLLEMDVHGEIGGIRELIGDYIVRVKGGILTEEQENNWRITGIDWDPDMRRKAVRLLAEGRLAIPSSADGRTPNVRSVTERDVAAAEPERV